MDMQTPLAGIGTEIDGHGQIHPLVIWDAIARERIAKFEVISIFDSDLHRISAQHSGKTNGPP